MKVKYSHLVITAITTLMLMCPVAYCDTVISQSQETNGRIKTVAAGLIVITDRGNDLTYQREVNHEYFGDAVMYKKNIFSRNILEVMGRVESLDRFNAIVYTPVGKIEIQRYKIKNIIMKVQNKGY